MKKVLLIEDEPALVDLYKLKFTKEGFNVITALDGESGMQFARTEKPDFIILDILLPVRNGIAFLKKLRSEPEISKIPVFVFSCLDEQDVKKQAYDLGVEDYILKTKYTPDQLVNEIKSYRNVTK